MAEHFQTDPGKTLSAGPTMTIRQGLFAIWLNGLLWSIGNALTTGNFIFYLARERGATGLGLSLLLALPNLVGVGRLLAPPWIARWGHPRSIYLIVTLLSYLVLAVGLPWIDLRSKESTLAIIPSLLIGLIVVHQAMEYLGQVGLWAWYGELVPRRVRGRIFAKRQAWQLLLTIPLSLSAGWFIDYAEKHGFKSWGYACVHLLGVLCLLGSIVPMYFMPATVKQREQPLEPGWRAVLIPFRDRKYWAFLIFRGWLSFANGWSQSAQFIWGKDVLGIKLTWQTVCRSAMQVGQLLLSASLGPWWDQWGYRWSLIVAQLFVACSLLLFLAAFPVSTTLLEPWASVGIEVTLTQVLFLLGWICWSAYAVHNVALPNLALQAAPPASRAAYIASYEALGSLLHAVATILGGVTYDWLINSQRNSAIEACQLMLCSAFGLRLLAAVGAYFIHEQE